MSRTVLRRVVIGAAVLLGFGAAGLVCQRVGERGRYASAFSTYGAGEEGTRGAYLLAEELGARPMRWAEDLGRLPAGGGMLVALGSCQQLMRRPMTRIERENLAEWVRGGGVLLVAGVEGYVDREHFGVALEGDPSVCRPSDGLLGMLARAEERERLRKRTDDGEGAERGDGATEVEDLPRAFQLDPSGTYDEVTREEELPPPAYGFGTGEPLDAVPMIGMRGPLSIEIEDEMPRHTLLRLDGPGGAPLGVRVDLGEGAVLAFASASMLQNRDLDREHGGVLFARLVREYASTGPVMFDEYHLGVGERRSLMRYLRQVGVFPIVVQILLLLLFVLWRVGARFGAARVDPPPEPAGTASYVEGVGTLYAKAKDPRGAGDVMVRRAIERIAAHHRMDAKDAPRLAEQLERGGRREAAAAVRELGEVSAPRRGLPRFAAELDALVQRALEDAA